MKFQSFILGALLIKGHETHAFTQTFNQRSVPITKQHMAIRRSSHPQLKSTLLFAEKKKKEDDQKKQDVDKMLSAAVGALKGVGVSILGDDGIEELNIAEQLKEQVDKEISMNEAKNKPADEIDLAEELKKKVDNEIAINDLKKQLEELKEAAEESEEKKILALQEFEDLKKQSMELEGKDQSMYKELQKEFR